MLDYKEASCTLCQSKDINASTIFTFMTIVISNPYILYTVSVDYQLYQFFDVVY